MGNTFAAKGFSALVTRAAPHRGFWINADIDGWPEALKGPVASLKAADGKRAGSPGASLPIFDAVVFADQPLRGGGDRAATGRGCDDGATCRE